jgi:hypothetical protein
MFSRAQSMKELNYISKDPDIDFINFALLEAVIKENPELWERLKVRSGASAGLEMPTCGTIVYNGTAITGPGADRSLIFSNPRFILGCRLSLTSPWG